MKIIAALLHDDVDHAAQGPAMFRFNSGGFDLDFLDEVKRDVAVRKTTGEIRRLWPSTK
jgi:hypothetical protein